MGFLLRLIINAFSLIVAAVLVNWLSAQGLFQGQVVVQGIEAAFVAAFVFGLVNALIRPILLAATCLINMLTLGLFTLVINALMLLLTSWFVEQINRVLDQQIAFRVEGFIAALLGALVVSVVSTALSRQIR